MRYAYRLFKNDRRIVGDEIDAGELLHELATNAEHGSIQELLLAVLEQRHESCAVRCGSFFFNGVLDLGYLCVDDIRLPAFFL